MAENEGTTITLESPSDIYDENQANAGDASIDPTYTVPDQIESSYVDDPNSMLNTDAPEAEAPELKTADEYWNPEATVMGQLSKYLDEDNPIFQRVEAKARDQAQAAGMLGTSMAEGAARGAVLDLAGDWATTDTQGYQSLLGQQQLGEYQVKQIGYEGDIQSKLQVEQGQIQKELDEINQSAANDRLLAQIASDQGISTDQINAQIKINQDTIMKDLAINDATLIHNFATDMLKIDSDNQQAYVDAMKDITYGYNENVAKILALPDDQMDPDTKKEMIQYLTDDLYGQSAMFASVWESDVTIEDANGNVINTPSMPPPPTTPAPTTPAPTTPAPTTPAPSTPEPSPEPKLPWGSGSGNYGQDYVPDLGW